MVQHPLIFNLKAHPFIEEALGYLVVCSVVLLLTYDLMRPKTQKAPPEDEAESLLASLRNAHLERQGKQRRIQRQNETIERLEHRVAAADTFMMCKDNLIKIKDGALKTASAKVKYQENDLAVRDQHVKQLDCKLQAAEQQIKEKDQLLWTAAGRQTTAEQQISQRDDKLRTSAQNARKLTSDVNVLQHSLQHQTAAIRSQEEKHQQATASHEAKLKNLRSELAAEKLEAKKFRSRYASEVSNLLDCINAKIAERRTQKGLLQSSEAQRAMLLADKGNCKRLQDLLAEAEAKLAAADLKTKDLPEANANLKTTAFQLQHAMDTAEQTVAERDAAIEKLQASMYIVGPYTDVQSQPELRTEEVSMTSDKASAQSLTDQLSDSQALVQLANTSADGYKARLDQALAANDQQASELESATALASDTEDRLTASQESLQLANDELVACNDYIASFECETSVHEASMKASIVDLEQRLAAKEEDCKGQLARLAALEKGLRTARRIIDGSGFDDLKEQVMFYKNNYTVLKEKLESSEMTVERLTLLLNDDKTNNLAKLKDLTPKFLAAQNSLAEQATKISQGEAIIAQLEAVIATSATKVRQTESKLAESAYKLSQSETKLREEKVKFALSEDRQRQSGSQLAESAHKLREQKAQITHSDNKQRQTETQLSQLSTQLRERKDQLSQSESEQRGYREAYESLHAGFRDLNKKRNAALALHTQAVADLEQTSAGYELQLEQQAAAHSTALATTTASLEQQKAHLETQTAKTEQYASLSAASRQHAREVGRERDAARGDGARIAGEARGLEKKLRKWKGELVDCKGELKRERKARDEAEGYVEMEGEGDKEFEVVAGEEEEEVEMEEVEGVNLEEEEEEFEVIEGAEGVEYLEGVDPEEIEGWF